MTENVSKIWQVGSIRQTSGIKVTAMVISAEIDGVDHDFDFRPDLAKALAEGLAATLLEYGGIVVEPRTTRH